MSERIDEHTDPMQYTDDMEAIDSDLMEKVIAEMESFDPDRYTEKDVRAALDGDTCSVEDFKALFPYINIMKICFLRWKSINLSPNLCVSEPCQSLRSMN